MPSLPSLIVWEDEKSVPRFLLDWITREPLSDHGFSNNVMGTAD